MIANAPPHFNFLMQSSSEKHNATGGEIKGSVRREPKLCIQILILSIYRYLSWQDSSPSLPFFAPQIPLFSRIIQFLANLDI